MDFFFFLYFLFQSGLGFVFLMLFIAIVLVVVLTERSIRKEREYKDYLRRKILNLVNNNTEVTPEEFFELRNAKVGKSKSIEGKLYNFPGVYVIHNQTKNMYYVGQGKTVLDRVNNHFTGKGNGDVYADYKYNDSFEISIIPFENSGFSSLNELEKLAINTYNAYTNGYNKTRGNQG